MEEVPARAGDRCEICGTPLEPAEINSSDDATAEEILLRCANGHEIRVTRHRDLDENADAEP